jgi:hypothetical protein
MTVNLEDVRGFIRHANANDLKLIGDILNTRWKHLQAELSFNFKPGDPVWFIQGKCSPIRVSGRVVAVDAKWVYIKVPTRRVGAGGWNIKVSPSLLKHV